MSVSTVPGPTGAELLAARLEDPQVAAALHTLLDHAELIAFTATALDGFVRHSETMLDSVGDSLSDARSLLGAIPGSGQLDAAALGPALAALAAALPKAVPALTQVLESGAVDELTSPETVRLLTVMTRSLNEGFRQYETRPVEIKGAGSFVRLLRDADLRQALSFAATIGRSLGRAIAQDRRDAQASAPR